MRKDHLKAVLATFLFGIFVGFYLYLTGFAGMFPDDKDIVDYEEAQILTINARVYGGCEMSASCPSFQVINDGSYTYRFTPRPEVEQVVKEGKLSKKMQNDLSRVLVVSELVRQSEPTDPAVCESFMDGIDVFYDITFNGEDYFLDSCGTAVNAESDLWTTLGSVWDYLEKR